MLDELGITHIINLAGNVCANKFPESFKYRRYYLKDSRFEVIIFFLNILEYWMSILWN